MRGNDLWHLQIQTIMEETGLGTKEAEIEAFYRLYSRMVSEGLKQEAIREHFETIFGIKHGAFYTRLRKVGQKYAI